MLRRDFLAAALVALAVAPVAAQDFPPYGDALYRPRLRQPGKDVMWLPTPDALVLRMLQAAKTGPRDIVYDLGAGDGRIPIAAAREFGATAVGIEYDAELAALARRNAERAGVADSEAFLWIVPARAEGRWTFADENRLIEGEIEFVQRFQRVGGTLSIRGTTQPLLGAFVSGAVVGFTFVAPDGGVRSVRADIDGAAMSGSLRFAGNLARFAGRRR